MGPRRADRRAPGRARALPRPDAARVVRHGAPTAREPQPRPAARARRLARGRAAGCGPGRGGDRCGAAVRGVPRAPRSRRRAAARGEAPVLSGAGAGAAGALRCCSCSRARARRSRSSATPASRAASRPRAPNSCSRHPTRTPPARSPISPMRSRRPRERLRPLGPRCRKRRRGALTPVSLGAVLARLQPEGAIVVDEGATSGLAYFGSRRGRTATFLSGAHGRSHRPGPALRDRRRARLPAAQGDRAPGGRQRPLHAPGALDPGARAARRRDTDLCEPQLSHPAARARARGHRRARREGAQPSPTCRIPPSTGRRWRAASACPPRERTPRRSSRQALGAALAGSGPCLIEAML